MTRGAFIFPALFFVATIALLALGYFYYGYPWVTFAFPFGAGLALCGLCALEMAKTLAKSTESGPAIEDEPDVSMSWPALGWLLALLLFLYGFGFVYGSAAYLLVCLLGNGFSWKIAVGSALVALVVTWGLFIKILGVLLPLQPLWMS